MYGLAKTGLRFSFEMPKKKSWQNLFLSDVSMCVEYLFSIDKIVIQNQSLILPFPLVHTASPHIKIKINITFQNMKFCTLLHNKPGSNYFLMFYESSQEVNQTEGGDHRNPGLQPVKYSWLKRSPPLLWNAPHSSDGECQN